MHGIVSIPQCYVSLTNWSVMSWCSLHVFQVAFICCSFSSDRQSNLKGLQWSYEVAESNNLCLVSVKHKWLDVPSDILDRVQSSSIMYTSSFQIEYMDHLLFLSDLNPHILLPVHSCARYLSTRQVATLRPISCSQHLKTGCVIIQWLQYKSGDILYFTFCEQIPQKKTNPTINWS